MNNTVIEHAYAYAKELFANEYSGHDFYHTERVWKTVRTIAMKEGADVQIAELAALLHDADDIKLSPETSEHKDRARSFMKKEGLCAEEMEAVIHIIATMSFNGDGSSVPSSPEGKCVQDADRLDAIGAIGIARAFAYGGSHQRMIHDPSVPVETEMTKEKYRSSNAGTLNHFYEKLFKLKDLMNTETGRQMAEERDAFMHAYVDHFLKEWEGRE